MADEYRLDEFFKAKMTAEARSGSDPRSSRGFGRTYVYENVRRAAEYERASARWDAFKSNQEADMKRRGGLSNVQRNRQIIGHQQSFIAPSRSLMRLTTPSLRGWDRTS